MLYDFMTRELAVPCRYLAVLSHPSFKSYTSRDIYQQIIPHTCIFALFDIKYKNHKQHIPKSHFQLCDEDMYIYPFKAKCSFKCILALKQLSDVFTFFRETKNGLNKLLTHLNLQMTTILPVIRNVNITVVNKYISQHCQEEIW